MKKYTKYLNLLASVLLIISLVLMLSCTGIIVSSIFNTKLQISGIKVLFGGELESFSKLQIHSAPLTLIGFILLIVGLVLICCFTILKIIKGNSKNVNMIILCGALFAIISSIFIFLTKVSFLQSNDFFEDAPLTLSGGYITASVLTLLGGVIALVDPVLSFIDNK